MKVKLSSRTISFLVLSLLVCSFIVPSESAVSSMWKQLSKSLIESLQSSDPQKGSTLASQELIQAIPLPGGIYKFVYENSDSHIKTFVEFKASDSGFQIVLFQEQLQQKNIPEATNDELLRFIQKQFLSSNGNTPLNSNNLIQIISQKQNQTDRIHHILYKIQESPQVKYQVVLKSSTNPSSKQIQLIDSLYIELPQFEQMKSDFILIPPEKIFSQIYYQTLLEDLSFQHPEIHQNNILQGVRGMKSSQIPFYAQLVLKQQLTNKQKILVVKYDPLSRKTEIIDSQEISNIQVLSPENQIIQPIEEQKVLGASGSDQNQIQLAIVSHEINKKDEKQNNVLIEQTGQQIDIPIGQVDVQIIDPYDTQYIELFDSLEQTKPNNKKQNLLVSENGHLEISSSQNIQQVIIPGMQIKAATEKARSQENHGMKEVVHQIIQVKKNVRKHDQEKKDKKIGKQEQKIHKTQDFIEISNKNDEHNGEIDAEINVEYQESPKTTQNIEHEQIIVQNLDNHKIQVKTSQNDLTVKKVLPNDKKILIEKLDHPLVYSVPKTAETELKIQQEERAIIEDNCLRYNGNRCIRCTLRYFLSNTGICLPIQNQCSSYNPYSGQCYHCYSGYYLRMGMCFKGNPLCHSLGSSGSCMSCYNNYELINGECFPRHSLSLTQAPTENHIPVKLFCLEMDSTNTRCVRCNSRTYVNIEGQCQIISPHCKQFDHENRKCVTCVRGFVPHESECIRLY